MRRSNVDGLETVCGFGPYHHSGLQHYQTFLERMQGFPVTVELLSRFRSPKQQEQILRKLRRAR